MSTLLKKSMQLAANHSSIISFIEQAQDVVGDPIIGWFDVTAQEAQVILDRFNTRNRTIIEGRVTTLANDQKEGLWHITGDAMSFDKGPTLISAQHRLKAQTQSGCTVRYLVAVGFPQETRDVTDQGACRTLRHQIELGLHTWKGNPATLAPASKAMYFGALVTRQNPSKKLLQRFAEEQATHLEWAAAQFASRKSAQAGVIGAFARAHGYAVKKRLVRKQEELAALYQTGIPGADPNDAAFCRLFRDPMMKGTIMKRSGGSSIANVYRIAQKLIKDYLDGKPIKSARPFDEELFPL